MPEVSTTDSNGYSYSPDMTFNVYTGEDDCLYVNMTCTGYDVAVISYENGGLQFSVSIFSLYCSLIG